MTEKRYKKLKCAEDLTGLMERHYAKARYFRFGRPLAWVTSGAPVELLRAMDVFPVYPENYGALCGARGEAVALCEAAEAQGYSGDLCSYARSSVGMMSQGKKAPLGGLPRPNLLVCCNNICGTVLKWYEVASRFYDTPLFVLDTPFIHDQLTEYSIQYVAAQLQELVRFVQKHTGRRLDQNKLKEIIGYSNQATALWQEIRELCRARPSPLNAPDLFINMAPIVVLRGTKEALGFYHKLHAEVQGRVQQGIGAIPQERYRLVWDNIAIWYRLYRFYSYFVDRGACFVADTYTGGWAMQLQAGEPFECLARTYTSVFLNQSLEYRCQLLLDLIQRFSADGFVMHSNRSCKPYSLGQYDIMRQVSQRSGVPGVIIEADMCDSRAYSEEQVKTRIQAFMETLDAAC